MGVGELGRRCAGAGTVKQLLHRLGPRLPPAPARQLADRPGLRWSTLTAGDAPQHPLHGGQHEPPSPTASSSPTSLPGTPGEHSTHIVNHHGLVTTVLKPETTSQASERMLPWGEGGCVRYKVGAEQLELVPAMVHRPGGVYRAPRTAPVGPTHAVDAVLGVAACGIPAPQLQVLDQDWEAAFVEKCPGCFTAVLAHGNG